MVADLGPLVLDAGAAEAWPTLDDGVTHALCDPSEVCGGEMKPE